MVYRTPEDTSQDYHIEGLPFGTRGGMLIPHVFPSDGEYQITMTPIFGDNMSPTGFGSVPCEKLEVLLDGERIADARLAGRRTLRAAAGQLRRPKAAAGADVGLRPARPQVPQDDGQGEGRRRASTCSA